jgi:thiol-disulfide isomerase/thioredoxin
MKRIRILIIALILVAVCIAGFTNYRHIRRRAVMERSIQLLPAFSFQRQDGRIFDNSRIDPLAERVLFDYFNPDCEHCQYMAGEFVRNADRFARYQLILVTIADSLAVDRFRKAYGLDKLRNLVILRDTKFVFANIFGPSMIPAFYEYGRDRKMIRKVLGETKLENLLK